MYCIGEAAGIYYSRFMLRRIKILVYSASSIHLMYFTLSRIFAAVLRQIPQQDCITEGLLLKNVVSFNSPYFIVNMPIVILT
jgi:hypothetical protein